MPAQRKGKPTTTTMNMEKLPKLSVALDLSSLHRGPDLGMAIADLLTLLPLEGLNKTLKYIPLESDNLRSPLLDSKELADVNTVLLSMGFKITGFSESWLLLKVTPMRGGGRVGLVKYSPPLLLCLSTKNYVRRVDFFHSWPDATVLQSHSRTLHSFLKQTVFFLDNYLISFKVPGKFDLLAIHGTSEVKPVLLSEKMRTQNIYLVCHG